MTGRIAGYLRTNVLGLVALFVAISAGAYAAGLPKNSVKSKQIKNGQVKSVDVADNSLLADDFAAGQLPVGAQGPKGDPGTSVTSANEPPGANCADGGSRFTSASGDTYACDGAEGDPGTSVTSANEPPGANCADGGSRFTSASGDTYACNGAQGAAGSSVAYASVGSTGNLRSGKNITPAQLVKTGVGTYCFNNLPFAVHVVMATPDGFGPTDDTRVNPTIGQCTGVNSVRIRTTTAGAPTTLVDRSFFVLFE